MLGGTMPIRRHAALVVLILLGVTATPAAALDDTPPVPLPAEPPSIELPGLPASTITFDLEDDGVRELVRILLDPNRSPGMIVEVTWVDRLEAGVVRVARSLPIRRDASVDEQLSALPRPDRNNTLAVSVGDPASLLLMRRDGEQRVVVAAEGSGGGTGRPCCLTLWEVVPDDEDGEALQLRRLDGIQQEAAEIAIADLDGDGTDELVAVEIADQDGPALLRVYHPFEAGGTDLVTVPVAGIGNFPQLMMVGETDGRDGDDVLLVAGGQAAESEPPVAQLVRITGDPAAPRIEIADPLREATVPLVVAAGDGRHLVLADLLAESTSIASWPPGGELRVERTFPELTGYPVAQLQADGASRVVTRGVRDGITAAIIDAEAMTVEDVDLDVVPIGGLSGLEDVSFRYSGPVVEATGEAPSRAIVDGTLLAFDGDGVTTQPVRDLLGLQVRGTLGAGGGLMALDRTLFASGPFQSFQGGSISADATVLVDAATVLGTAAGGELVPGLRGAVRDPADPTRILTAERAIEVLVDAPAGSRVAVHVGANAPFYEELSWTPLDAGTTPIVVRPGSDDAVVRLVVVTATGAVYASRLRIVRLTDDPTLVLDPPDAAWSGSVPVGGQTDPGASVTVDGAPVAVDADGRFATTVSAGLVPTNVSVEAIDLLGRRTATSVSVVGWLDYRSLPWIPMFVVMTLVAGALLWIRKPRPQRWSRRGPEDDAALEEIEG